MAGGYMDAMQAIRAMMSSSGLTHRQIAHRLGKYDTYVSQVLSRGKTPQTDTLTDIAHACGYTLQLVPMDGGNTIIIGDGSIPDTAPDIQQARALLQRAAAILDDLDS